MIQSKIFNFLIKRIRLFDGFFRGRAGSEITSQSPISTRTVEESKILPNYDLKVSNKWGTFAERRHTDPKYQRVFAMDHPIVQEYVYNTYLEGESPFVYVRRFLPYIPCNSGLEIACGSGDLSIAVVNTGLCKQVDACDISERAIAIAKQSAQDAKIDNIRFTVADANTMVLPKNHYDFIYMSQSLHHIEELEHLYQQVNDALTDDGVFFVADYIGPTRMQWTDKQLTIMNTMLSLLPERLRLSLDNQNIRKVIERTAIKDFLRIDPSEGVRAGEIFSIAQKQFDILDFRPMGLSIIYELFLNIIHNFDDQSEYDIALLKLICFIESLLVKEGIIASDFGCFVAKKKVMPL